LGQTQFKKWSLTAKAVFDDGRYDVKPKGEKPKVATD
jgi:hypothetical protein